jgi:hypothetical protein
MKRFFNPCRRHRRDIALLAAGALPEPDRESMENHLATCAPCRAYLAELQCAAVPVAKWAESAANLQPSAAAKDRWACAVRAAAGPRPVPTAEPSSTFGDWWHDVVWSSRRVWAGLAAVWMLILAGNLSLHDHPQGFTARSSRPAKEIMMAFKDRQTTLADLLADHSTPDEADRPKLFLPKPRTEYTRILGA